MPAFTSSALTHSSRIFSAHVAMRWSPAAPISARAFFVKPDSIDGRRDSAWRSSRRRRAAVTSASHGTSTVNRFSLRSSSLASPWCVLAT